MIQPIFITGIGTGVGKTLVSAIVTSALQADYWKPVQAGYAEGTDSSWVKNVLHDTTTVVHPEVYRLAMPASPHIAARQENTSIDLNRVYAALQNILPALEKENKPLVIEGAGGLLVPLNETAFVVDLIQQLRAKVILVSRNYLGSINHSLLTAAVCRAAKLDVLGWIFNDQYMAYESEIVQWSGFPALGSIPFSAAPDASFIAAQGLLLRETLKKRL